VASPRRDRRKSALRSAPRLVRHATPE
jgi:hypothetical protein